MEIKTMSKTFQDKRELTATAMTEEWLQKNLHVALTSEQVPSNYIIF